MEAQPLARWTTPMSRSAHAPALPFHVASAGHGLLTATDLRTHGVSRHGVQHALDRGDLVRVAPGLFAVTGAPRTDTQRALIATHSPSGALSHRSSGAWWGLPKLELEPFHVVRLRPGSTTRSSCDVLHQPTRLTQAHLTNWRDVPVTRPGRTLFDLAATEHPKLVERTYDTMWSRGLITPEGMDRLLVELSGRGCTGVVLMRELIGARRHLEQPTGSRLEQRFEVLNDRAGIPMLRRQVQLGDGNEWIGRLDFVGEERKLVVEVDSEIHHSALLDTQRDERQTEQLEAASWHVWRIREDDLWNNSVWVVEELRRRWRAAPAR